MEHKQALEVIKQVLDAAVKGGVFPNMDASFTAAQAYNIIANKLVDKEKELDALD
jgi:hypothetical protein